ncbi:MAG: tyrosine recombinase XerC [Clostridia bacterium]|nr:tyrosine recombinase XerC [Clostridia bacterium]
MFEGYKDVPQYVEKFLLYINNAKNRSKNTIKEYYYDLRNFFKYIKNEKYNLDYDEKNIDASDLDLEFIKEISYDDLNRYIAYLSINKSDKPVTRARKIASLKSFFNFLCFKEKVLTSNPTVELETPKLPKRLPKYLTLDESKALLHSIDGKFKERDFAIITLFLNCGLRLSELIQIDIANIKTDKLNIIGKGNKEREIHLNRSCLEAINNYIKVRQKVGNIVDRNALFLSTRGKRISNRMVELIVKKYIVCAGLDPKKFSPHKLRHTAATLMHKHSGVDIRALQQILGHESISTTEIYTHIDNEQIKAALDSNPLNNIK